MGKITEKAENIISAPYNKLSENLSEEAQRYGKGTQLAGEVASVVGNMVPSIATTMITGNGNIGLGVMGVSAKGGSTDEAMKKVLH